MDQTNYLLLIYSFIGFCIDVSYPEYYTPVKNISRQVRKSTMVSLCPSKRVVESRRVDLFLYRKD